MGILGLEISLHSTGITPQPPYVYVFIRILSNISTALGDLLYD
jgi:hypothetical protein